jgi:hypothetical protein
LTQNLEEARLNAFDMVKEQDTFRLAILGHAAVEERIDAAISEAFRGSTPGELKGLPFRTRLALFAALTQLPEKYLAALTALAKLRNRFAHGDLDELSSERAKPLVDAFRPLLPDNPDPRMIQALDPTNPRIALATCLLMAQVSIESLAEFTRKRREEERKGLKALRFQEDLKRLLADHEST